VVGYPRTELLVWAYELDGNVECDGTILYGMEWDHAILVFS
jgi:hypothetical protein